MRWGYWTKFPAEEMLNHLKKAHLLPSTCAGRSAKSTSPACSWRRST
jgi:hypothetical protein